MTPATYLMEAYDLGRPRGKVQRILGYLEARVEKCREGYDRWQAMHDAGLCEKVSVATERSALFEAEHILGDVRELLGMERYAPVELDVAQNAGRVALEAVGE